MNIEILNKAIETVQTGRQSGPKFRRITIIVTIKVNVVTLVNTLVISCSTGI